MATGRLLSDGRAKEVAWSEALPPLAGRQGLEPRFIGPEPIVLPLNDLPTIAAKRAGRWMVHGQKPRRQRAHSWAAIRLFAGAAAPHPAFGHLLLASRGEGVDWNGRRRAGPASRLSDHVFRGGAPLTRHLAALGAALSRREREPPGV